MSEHTFKITSVPTRRSWFDLARERLSGKLGLTQRRFTIGEIRRVSDFLSRLLPIQL